jgi:3-mercaptopyruvate sulfurtransferase SseA
MAQKIRVSINGYGVIGKRVADAVALQDDMELAGIADVVHDYRIRVALERGYAVFSATPEAGSPAEFSGRVPGQQVVRPGHIPGAVNVDWARNLTPPPRRFKSRDVLRQLYQDAGVTPEKEVVVYCRTGARASHDDFVLQLLGYEHVRLYDGPFVEWSAKAVVPVAR